MDMDQNNLFTNENSAVKPIIQKKSPATALAFLSLILVVALLITFFITVRDLNERYDELSEKYRQTLENQTDTEQEQTPDISIEPEDMEQAQIVIDQSSAAISTIVSAVRPSVVCVCVTVPSQTIDYGYAHYQTQAATSTGSGIIWTENGYIITNQHVVEYAQQYKNAYITILFDDGTEAEARLIAADSQTDLAVLKVDGKEPLPAATFGTSKDLLVGQTAIAIGNPLGVEYANSVTVGIVSGLNRQVTGENGVSTMIQTDAAVNPGNSGGALVDASGKVIGVVSAKISSTEVEGIGFAIPINDALEIVTSLKEFGYVKDRPATGIAAGTEITESLSRRYRLPRGLYITEITEGSGAEQAGIQIYDIILEFDGITVTTLDQIEAIKKNHKVGDRIAVSYYQYRTGKTVETTLILTEDKG